MVFGGRVCMRCAVMHNKRAMATRRHRLPGSWTYKHTPCCPKFNTHITLSPLTIVDMSELDAAVNTEVGPPISPPARRAVHGHAKSTIASTVTQLSLKWPRILARHALVLHASPCGVQTARQRQRASRSPHVRHTHKSVPVADDQRLHLRCCCSAAACATQALHSLRTRACDTRRYNCIIPEDSANGRLSSLWLRVLRNRRWQTTHTQHTLQHTHSHTRTHSH
jgi:hypothetical protein